jgi:hypothetical protein
MKILYPPLKNLTYTLHTLQLTLQHPRTLCQPILYRSLLHPVPVACGGRPHPTESAGTGRISRNQQELHGSGRNGELHAL